MPKRKHEKPQAGNPHQLTIDQHVFPRRSIERFVGLDGMVAVCLKNKQESFRAAPNNTVFCARRVWDQRAESGYMAEIEGKFQSLASLIVEGSLRSIGDKETEVVSDFWRLWLLRAEYRLSPIPDERLKGISHEGGVSKDQQEQLEKLHIGFIREDGVMPGRHIVGGQIQVRLLGARKTAPKEKWGIIHADKGEFIVPDVFLKDRKTCRIVPLTPTCCLMSPHDNAAASLEDVRRLNQSALEYCQEFYFARDFSKCPQ